MNKFIVLALTACSLILFSCQQQKEVSQEVVSSDKLQQKDDKSFAVDDLHQDIKLNIHVRHFNDDGKQRVSPWVFSELTEKEKKKYYSRKDFVRHHEFYQIKEGICDNTVKTIEKDTGKIIYRCGGHTTTQR